jgi:beta-lactam-binding protein with PASTA domain
VTVNVSTGPPTTPVPNVLQDTVSQATTALENDGLSVSGVSGSPNNKVVGTQPSIGSTVQIGSSVQLFTK